MELKALAQHLQERHDLIADRDFYERDPEGHLLRLQQVSAELEQWERDHAATLDPVLKHYLERRSYSKALAYCHGETEHRI